ncbi:MAG: hypothetical protein AMXMBFR81_19140 [Chthonomonas sp.]
MIATLTKGSGGTYQVSARRYTDPWGVTRVGASTGSPDQRYCASLGHRQDDESCLTYMRARYYEPTTGRFVSEDPAREGAHWQVYCGNNPVTRIDGTGKSIWEEAKQWLFSFAAGATGAAIAFAVVGSPESIFASISSSICAVVAWSWYFGATSPFAPVHLAIEYAIGMPLMKLMVGWAADSVLGLKIASRSLAFTAVAASFGYSLVLWGVLLGMEEMG